MIFLSKNFKLIFIIFFFFSSFLFDAKAQSLKIITLDWTIAEILVELGVPPIGIGDKRAYQRWVKAPILPNETIDLGSRTLPNVELIISLQPDFLINSSWWAQQLPSSLLNRFPNHQIDFYPESGANWNSLVKSTKDLGKLINKEIEAQNFIEQTQNKLIKNKINLQRFQNHSFAIVQFIDPQHLRIFGENSLFGITLQRLSLKNAWPIQENLWGFQIINLSQLVNFPENTILVIVKPYPNGFKKRLEKNRLWNVLSFSKSNKCVILPEIWSFGGLPSMNRFSDLLTEKITQYRDFSC